MNNRYKEVLMTYLRRPFSSWRAMIGQALLAWSIFSDGGGMPGHIGAGSVLNGVGYGSALLWFHFRSQAVGPNRKLAPGYLLPTIAAFLAISLSVVLAPPTLLAIRHGCCDGAFFALAVFEFGLIGCALASENWLVATVCGLAILCPGIYFIRYNYAPHNEVGYFAAGLLGCGLAAGVWAVLQMTGGPIRDGGFLISFGGSANLESVGRSAGRLIGSLLGSSRSVGQMRAPIPAAKISYGPPMVLEGTIRDSLRRWRHMRMLEASVLPALFLLCFAVSIIFGGFAHSASGVTQDFSAVVPFAAFWPAAVVAGRWQQAWPCIRAESLRPESRAAFALGVFTSMAAQLLLAWLIFAVATLAASAIAGLGLSGMEPLASGLLATLLIQPLAYTALCWLLPYGTSAWMFFMVPLVFAMLGLGATTIFGGVSLAIGVATVCMLLGLILVPFVYRRWMNLEMG